MTQNRKEKELFQSMQRSSRTETIPYVMKRKCAVHFIALIPSFLFILCPFQVLSCLVQIASVRRSLFNNAERAKFLSHLVDGVKRILENPQVSIWTQAVELRPCLLSIMVFHQKYFLMCVSHLCHWSEGCNIESQTGLCCKGP